VSGWCQRRDLFLVREHDSDEDLENPPEDQLASVEEKVEEDPAADADEDEEEEEEEDDDADASQGSDGEDLIAARFSDRSQRLQERSSQVEDAIKAIANLHMAYRHGQEDGLSVRDLELKRGQLRMEVCLPP
jgi:TATA-binding protein-associated factor Taf7